MSPSWRKGAAPPASAPTPFHPPAPSSPRLRHVGRIGGIVGPAAQRGAERLAAALGPAAQVLDMTADDALRPLVDWDCCWLDGAPLCDLDAWRSVIGAGRLAEVNGAFAIAWREPDGAVTLARDAVGERTLFYAALPAGLVFASTVQALLATGLVERRLDLVAVAAYLSYSYVPGRATLVAGIRELLPGERIRYRDGTFSHAALWTLPAEDGDLPRADEEAQARRSGRGGSVDLSCAGEEEQARRSGRGEPVDLLRAGEAALCRRLRADLERAVARRLPAGERVGAFLSGGLDSSLVVALARRLHDAPVRTYSVHFGADFPNELPYSSAVAELCGTEHRVVELAPATVVRHLDDAISLLSTPIGDPLTVPNALLFREAAQEVGVVLNGEGGDPLFGGPKNLPMLLAELFGGGVGSPDDPYVRERSYLRAHLKCYDELPRLLAPHALEALRDNPLEAQLAPLFADPRRRNFVTKLMAINLTFKGAHHILPKVDALSAAAGVVARAPLFDREVVETAFAIPPQLKLFGSTEKYLLKQSVRDLLPAAIVDRPKSGMRVPVESWFRGPLIAHARERLLDGLAPYGLFRRDYLERLLSGRPDDLPPRSGAKIWQLATLESWLRTVFSPVV